MSAGQLLSLLEVERITGLSHATIYRRIAAGSFPKPLNAGRRSAGWSRADVTAWAENRPPTVLAEVDKAISRELVSISLKMPERTRTALLFAAEERRTNLDGLLRQLLTVIGDQDLVGAVLDT